MQVFAFGGRVEQAVLHSAVAHRWPPMALQVCSASMGVTLNQGIFPWTEQAGVLSRVTPAGAGGSVPQLAPLQ
jgi:hypothetical protein